MAGLGVPGIHPGTFNMDTKNDGLEQVFPFKHGDMLGVSM